MTIDITAQASLAIIQMERPQVFESDYLFKLAETQRRATMPKCFRQRHRGVCCAPPSSWHRKLFGCECRNQLQTCGKYPDTRQLDLRGSNEKGFVRLGVSSPNLCS